MFQFGWHVRRDVHCVGSGYRLNDTYFVRWRFEDSNVPISKFQTGIEFHNVD